MGHVDPKTGEVLPPFKWDEEERVHLRARLDALYFLLYGVTDRDDVRYILSTFPGVREDDEKKFGRYRTEEMILAYISALEAGERKQSSRNSFGITPAGASPGPPDCGKLLAR